MTGQHAYLRSGWNVMDGTLVAVSFLDLFISLTTPHGQRNSFGILRVFRLLRTLRPLRRVIESSLCLTEVGRHLQPPDTFPSYFNLSALLQNSIVAKYLLRMLYQNRLQFLTRSTLSMNFELLNFDLAVTVYRVISRAPGLKLVVQTLLSSLRPIGNIVLICCTFFIIFGILGVQVTHLTR